MVLKKRKSVKKKNTRQAMRRRGKQQSLQLSSFLPSLQMLKQFMLLLLALIVLVGFVHSYHWIMRPDTLPISQVSVSGELEHTDADQLRSLITSSVKGGFFSLNLKQVKADLEKLPWVYRVSLRRDWPNLLRIHIKEQVPVVTWQGDKLINQYGQVFTPSEDSLPEMGLPEINGVTGRELVLLERYIQYSKMLTPVDVTIRSIDEDPRLDQHLLLENGVELVLGRDEREDRLQRFVNIYQSTLAAVASKIASLDLRYSNGFSVRWHEQNADNLKQENGHV